MQAIPLEDDYSEKAWLELLQFGSGARVQHTLEWKRAVEEAYPQLKPAYYLVERGKEDYFGFASFFCKSALFGNRAVSLPFVDYGGFVGSPSSEGTTLLFSKLRARFSADKLEVRLSEHSEVFKESEKALLEHGFVEQKHLGRQVAVVELDSEKKMWEGFDKHTRNDVRKAGKSGLLLEFVDSQKQLDSFYQLYFRAMKRFGTPQHSKKFFECLWNNFGGWRTNSPFHGFNCYKDGRLAGSLAMLAFNGYAQVFFSVSEPELREFRPNDFLYWQALRAANEAGAKFVDLGQVQKDAPAGSHAAGIFEFKKKWGAKLFERPVYYFGYGNKNNFVQGQSSEAEAKTGGNEKLRKLAQVWKKLPDPLVRKLGPWLCRQRCA